MAKWDQASGVEDWMLWDGIFSGLIWLHLHSLSLHEHDLLKPLQLGLSCMGANPASCNQQLPKGS